MTYRRDSDIYARYNIIPVVRGSGDYASIAPPHSYIDVRDFESPEELAKYLTYLDKNDTAYMEYFKWKPNYIAFPAEWFAQAISYCDLCERLHSDKEEKIHYDLKEWFDKKANCNKNL
ncbi:hypothetical protein Anas_01417 [Armadillidium nasatum]|uniref:Fucosyltransferase n=1 Tax=Armadillidium nasatum TaxID=96803 RepID=A0A5N5SNY1_9CRUS|nr:hypothetical protein Anas_01417 [Armadillidium nasatum]